MTAALDTLPLIDDELQLLGELVPLERQNIIELGCGAATLARALLQRHPESRVVALEVDLRQHAKNIAAPQAGLQFIAAGAEAIPVRNDSFDLALMLKSLHHVPLPLLGGALREIARVLRPDGHLYVSEPVYAGAFNDLVKLFNDEGVVRAAAQSALDDAVRSGAWEQVAERRFDVPMRFTDFAEFEERLMRPTFADHGLDRSKVAAVRAAFEPHMGPQGAQFTRPMHVRLLRRRA